MNDPIQDLRDVAANVTAHPNHVAIIAAAAVLHLADELQDLRANIDERFALFNGEVFEDPPLDHILDEME